jgi:hypothetical protein
MKLMDIFYATDTYKEWYLTDHELHVPLDLVDNNRPNPFDRS